MTKLFNHSRNQKLAQAVLKRTDFGCSNINDISAHKISLFRKLLHFPKTIFNCVNSKLLITIGCIMTQNIVFATYGSWKSPITAEEVVKGSVRLSCLSSEGNELIWSEGRPEESGRYVIVSERNGNKVDLIPQGFNVRTRVHEYGGKCHAIHEDMIYFVDFQNQHLYCMKRGEKPEVLIGEKGKRFADFVVSPNGRYLYSVMEDHSNPENVKNSIVCVDIVHQTIRPIAEGYDFYAEPRLSPNGQNIAWIAWNHPDMSWDNTDLFTATVSEDGSVSSTTKIPNQEDVSALNPIFSPDNVLYYVHDGSGFWNIYRFENGKSHPVCPMEADFSHPMWVFGTKRILFLSYKNRPAIATIYTENAVDKLGIIFLDDQTMEEVDTPYTSLESMAAYKNGLAVLAASPTRLPSVVYLDLQTETSEVIFESQKLTIDSKYFSIPRLISYKTGNQEQAHGIFFPPCNPDYQAEDESSSPPLIVHCHGGPTACVQPTLSLKIQYWTSRGFGVLAVNYRGSSGYGSKYRRALFKRWGIVDVEDAIYGARYLVQEGDADPDKTIIVGGSAGGYTVLAALTFEDFFNAGTSYFGVSDLEALAKDTHKFESRYLDKLIGKYPEERDIYQRLSPIQHIEKLKTPLLLLQGGEDKIVPPDQSRSMFEALKDKRIPTAYLEFPHEQHGFRDSKAIIKSLESEYSFYAQVFGFQTGDAIEAIKIEGL